MLLLLHLMQQYKLKYTIFQIHFSNCSNNKKRALEIAGTGPEQANKKMAET